MTTATYRGTSNTNARGSSESRRRRRQYLVDTYRADVDAVITVDTREQVRVWTQSDDGTPMADLLAVLESDPAYPVVTTMPACRCYRCGVLLTVDTVTSDRIVPGCVKTAEYPNGGTYVRKNIRPCCSGCNSSTGGVLGNLQKRKAS